MESKADDTYPIVSAASICAKVTRDHALRDFVYCEKGIQVSDQVGCGYPGDAVTRKWLINHMDDVFGFPSLVRFSWKTAYEMLDKQDKLADFHNVPESIQDGSNKAGLRQY